MPLSSSPLDQAILCTLLYGDVFSFPMTADEIHYFLIGMSTEKEAIYNALESPSEWLKKYIVSNDLDGLVCYALIDRADEVFAKRREREAISKTLWSKGRHYGVLLGYLPFVRMVAMTGALAVRNVGSPDDDLDYLVVARDGRVWLARLFSVILVRICRLWGVVLCPNYVLAESALSQNRRDLFIAHEVTQMVPMVGHNLYQKMRLQNDWVETYLPNANGAFYNEPDGQPRRLGKWLKKFGELILSGVIGNWLENWEMRRKIRKFEHQQTKSSEVQLDKQQVKGHFIDYGNMTLQRFQERLEQHDLHLPNVLPTQHSSAAD